MRRNLIIFCIFGLVLTLFSASIVKKITKREKMQPPIAKQIPYSFKMHNITVQDEYAWLRDKGWPEVKNPEILDYLNAENQYFEQFFAPTQDLKTNIFEELKGRVKLADQSTYIKKDNYYYYTRTEADKEYPIYCRKNGSTDSPEEILLDVNKLAAGKSFTQIGTFAISPDHKLFIYSVDFSGDERYTIKIYNIQEKEHLVDEILDVNGSIVWHQEIAGFFYTPINEQLRSDKVKFHLLNSDYKLDKLIFHETDTLQQVGISRSSSQDYLFINSSGYGSNEVYAIAMKDHEMMLQLLRAKEDTIFYDVDHNGDYFYIRTNLNATNFCLMTARANDLAAAWQKYIPEDKDKYLASFDITKNYLILNYTNNGLPLVRIQELQGSKEQDITFPDQAFEASAFSTNFAEDDIRVNYSSLARPSTVYSYDFPSNKLAVLKVQEIPSGFNPEEYMVERVFAEHDGVKVPITLLYKKALFKKDGSNPLYLYGYGSYGIAIPTSFRNSAISLVNRGFVFAIAHIRGGEELGHQWYEAAKFLNKKRTFSDFIRSTEYLIEHKYTQAGNIVICGGSAGGLLIGNVINERPELFKAAIAHVPFVDALNTMLDESLPLTPGEFKEWGNPKEPVYFEYILSYSPYDNIKPQAYPSLMVTAGLSDPRVGYWEAAKWVARLRAKKLGQESIIFKTNMDYGHKGASGRFDYLKEAAEDLVFVFKIFGTEL